jgi:NitT/TauT family transport system substrate-binding protein
MAIPQKVLRLVRRYWKLGAVLAIASLLTAPYQTSAQELRKLRIATIPIVDYGGLWICMEKGFCEQAGISLENQTLGGGAAIISAMRGGSLDLGAAGIVPTLLARAQGFDLKIVALASAADINDLLLVKDPAIKTGKDFEGKTVAVNELRGVGQTWVMAWVAANDGDPSKVKFQEFPVPGMIPALAQGRIDVAQVSEPFRSEGIKQGLKTVASGKLAESIAVAGIVVTEKFLAENEALMVRFVDAFARSQEYATKNPDEVRKVLPKYTKLGDTAATVALVKYPTEFRRDDIDFWKQSLNKYAGANINFGFDDIVWKRARIAN